MWVLIDMSFLAHRARHSLGHLETEDMPTGVLFGFFEQLYTICTNPNISSNRVVVFADSRHSYRRKAFPGYKHHRADNRTEEEEKQIEIMREQVTLLRKHVLPAMGIHVYAQKGLESDDLMAWSAAALSKQKKNSVMVTSDSDLMQCIDIYAHWYDPQRDILHTPWTFQRLKNVTPEQWGLVKALGGCTTDSVPGIAGVSEKGAIDYLHDNIPHHHKKYQKIKDALANGEVEKWKELVVLPHKKTKPVRLRPPVYKREAFYEFCKQYDIDSYLEGPQRILWDRFFDGRIQRKPQPRTRGNTCMTPLL